MNTFQECSDALRESACLKKATDAPYNFRTDLANLPEQHRIRSNDPRYDDRNRLVPALERLKKILAFSPYMATQKRLIGTLPTTLKQRN